MSGANRQTTGSVIPNISSVQGSNFKEQEMYLSAKAKLQMLESKKIIN
jgi:hypothetical protein